MFSPEEESITKGGPNNRRRFFNKVFSIVSKNYLEDLLNYNSILQQRNAVLKNDSKKDINSQIKIWNEPFSEKAEKIWKHRKKLFFEFSEVFKETVKNLDLGVECEISYNQKEIKKEIFLKKLKKKRKEADFALGFSNAWSA